MKGIIKRGSMRCLSFAAACLITVSDTGYYGSVLNICAVSQTGQYKTWKQNDSRWGDLHLGKSGYNMRGSGCAATSLAFLLVHAGNFSEDIFDPGIFCRLMSQYGGFASNGNILWEKVNNIAPGFEFVGTHYIEDEITLEERCSIINEYYSQGYFLIIDVQDSGHWVAIDRVDDDGKVISFDPGGDRDTDVFKQYEHTGNTCIKIFKSRYISSTPPAVMYNYNTGVYVTTTELNVRKSPTSSSELLGKLSKGTRVDVRGISGCWGKIILDSAPAWICLEYTEPYRGNANTVTTPQVTTTAVTTPVTTTHAVTTHVTTTTVTTTPVTTTNVTTTPVTALQTTVVNTTASAETAVSVTSSAKQYRTGVYKTIDWLNYRKSPDVKSELFGTMDPDTEIIVSEVSGNWGRTEFKGKTCWVCLDYAAFVSDKKETSVTTVQTTAETTAGTTVQTTAVTTTVPVTEAASSEPVSSDSEKVSAFRCKTTSALNLREKAGTEYGIFCVIPKDTELTVYDTDSGSRWGRVKYQNHEGWVCLDYVVLCEEDSSENSTEEKPEPEEKQEADLPSAGLLGSAAQGASAIRSEPDENGIIRGDVDRNGFINILDYILLRSVFAGKGGLEAVYEADVNGDGAVTIHDLLELRAMFLQE